jgi:cobalamin synthase
MKIREAWQRQEETIKQERGDERAQLIGVYVTRDAALAAALAAVVGMMVLLMAPLSDQQRVGGLGVLLITVLAAGAVTLSVSEYRRGASSPEFVRASAPRQAIGMVGGATIVGVLAFAFGYRDWEVILIALVFLLVSLLSMAVRLRRLRSRGDY